MEGGAKGQVGGMEMGKDERLRLAKESRRWRCFGCGGKSGEEILREEAEKVEREGKKTKGEEAVPPELRMGFKDEMENGSTGPSETLMPSTGHPSGAPSTNSSITSAASVQHSSPPQGALNSASRVFQSSPSANSSTVIPPLSPPDPVPAWIDKAIAGVVASLAIMIIKKTCF